MTALEEAIATQEIFRQELELCQQNLSAARASRDDALGRAALAERRAVKAEGSIEAINRALSLPPLFWPFIGFTGWGRRAWRRVSRFLHRKVRP